MGGCVLGLVIALVALTGRFARVAFLVSIPLYVSYVTACGTFLSFQWDQLLVESLFLALWLPPTVLRRGCTSRSACCS